jgi:hypothetical protein
LRIGQGGVAPESLGFKRSLDGLQLLELWLVRVVIVQGIAPTDQPIPGGGGVIAKGAPNVFLFQGTMLDGIEKDGWVNQDHAAQANRIGPTMPDDVLGHLREEFLQVTVAGADHDQVRGGFGLELTDHVDLAGYVHERIVGRLVTVGEGIGGRTLNMRIEVGRTSAEVEQLYTQLPAQFHELQRFGQIVRDRIVGVEPETVTVR